MINGGMLMIGKGKMEINERIEGRNGKKRRRIVNEVLWKVIVKIVVIDEVL